MVAGVYLIGIAGNIGSTVVASSLAMKKSILKKYYGMITKTNQFKNMRLISEKELFVGKMLLQVKLYIKRY